MERLTKWLNDKKNLCIKKCEKECVEGYTECHKCEPFKDVMIRLAEYEDAEEQGLLLRLPYPLGTEDLYFADNDDWYVLDARKIQAQKMPDGKILYEIDNFEFWEEDFGKIVFLTQEEAELELANRQQSHAETIMDERNGR